MRAPAERAAYREWVLPDYQERMVGHVRELEVSDAGYLRRTREGEADDGEQALKLESERFGIPELLFRPQDCGERAF